MDEKQVEQLKETFLKQNPFAKQAMQAYVDTPSNVPTDPLYAVLMAIAFELWLRSEAS